MAIPDTVSGERADALAVVALGANLAGATGDPAARIEAALSRFSAHGLHLVKRSRLWESQAWPDPTDPPFLNAVALIEPTPGPETILKTLLALEDEFGRARGARNAPRTLDLDLIAHGRVVLDTPDLKLPHPRAAERLFVMAPLAEIAPDWRHSVLDLTAASLAKSASVGADARPIAAAAAPLADTEGPELREARQRFMFAGKLSMRPKPEEC